MNGMERLQGIAGFLQKSYIGLQILIFIINRATATLSLSREFEHA